MQKVDKIFDEEGNDITVYDNTEYMYTKQVALNSLFSYEEVENVQLPVIAE